MSRQHRVIYNDDGGGISMGSSGDPVEKLREWVEVTVSDCPPFRFDSELGLTPRRLVR